MTYAKEAMGYHDHFKPTSHYYGIINELVSAYRGHGCVTAVSDWEKKISKVTDLPSLVNLSRQAEFLLMMLEERNERQHNL